MMVRTLMLVCLVAILASGCGWRKGPEPLMTVAPIADIAQYPQDLTVHAQQLPWPQKPLLAPDQQEAQCQYFLNRFFAAWGMRAASMSSEAAFRDMRVHVQQKKGWGANLLPMADKRRQALLEQARMDEYPSMARPAIITTNTALRMAPDRQPFFLNPGQAGEGFPFDYFQYSALWTGLPVLVVHASQNGEWLMCETPMALGWVHATNVAFVDDAFMRAYGSGEYAAILDDNVPLRTEDGRWLATGHIGTVLPLVRRAVTGYVLRIPVRGADGNARLHEATARHTQATQFPLTPSAGAVALLGNKMMAQPYGWGGLFDNRDCSSTLRDLFTPFGIWLPRNSSMQARAGRGINLEDVPPEQREEYIMQQGVPFFSMLWMRGHIGLYVGDMANAQGRRVPLMFHNMWGVRTGGEQGVFEGRALVGRAVISSLRVGEELPGVQRSRMLQRMRRLTILPPSVP